MWNSSLLALRESCSQHGRPPAMAAFFLCGIDLTSARPPRAIAGKSGTWMPSMRPRRPETILSSAQPRSLRPLPARADAAEQARRLPAESARDMLDLGLARILMPARFGGYELDFETWHDAVLAISRADASHGWCASLIVHHAHLVAQFPEECQQAVWADGPDVAIAASFAPRAQAVRVPGGYRVSGENSSFSSGVDHSTWVMVGAMLPGEGAPEWVFFMIPPGDYTVRDTWFTAGMRGTGSNTIVTDNVFVPETADAAPDRSAARPGPGRCAVRQSDLPHAVLLLRAAHLCRADARRSAGRLCAFPRMDQAAQGGRWLGGRGEDRGAGADGARRGRSRRRRDAAAPRPREMPNMPAGGGAAACWRARSAISRGCRKCRSPPSTR